jgi:hypothetical protein
VEAASWYDVMLEMQCTMRSAVHYTHIHIFHTEKLPALPHARYQRIKQPYYAIIVINFESNSIPLCSVNVFSFINFQFGGSSEPDNDSCESNMLH